MKPEDLFYAETHEWVHVDDANIATVGISSFAVEQLTDLVFMELKDTGTAVGIGDEFGEVESVKAVSPLYSPVLGEVVEVNSDLPDNLEILGTDPYEKGWIARIKLAEGATTDHLMDFAAYTKQCAESS